MDRATELQPINNTNTDTDNFDYFDDCACNACVFTNACFRCLCFPCIKIAETLEKQKAK